MTTDTNYQSAADPAGQAEQLIRMRESLSRIQAEFQAKRPVADGILQDSRTRYDKIMGMLNQQLHQAETERARLASEVATLKNSLASVTAEKKQTDQLLAAVQAEKAAREAELNKAAGQARMLDQEAAALRSELDKARVMAETSIADRDKMEKKLSKLQEQWDKFIAGG